MREAVVVASSRTGLAKSHRGSLNMTRPDDQAAHCIKEVLSKTPELDPVEIGDVYMGCTNGSGPHGGNIARTSAMLAGLPITVGGATVNRACSSGLNAIALAAHEIVHEGVDAAIGAGTESITMGVTYAGKPAPNPLILENMPALYMAMGNTAEVVANRYKVSRDSQDE